MTDVFLLKASSQSPFWWVCLPWEKKVFFSERNFRGTWSSPQKEVSSLKEFQAQVNKSSPFSTLSAFCSQFVIQGLMMTFCLLHRDFCCFLDTFLEKRRRILWALDIRNMIEKHDKASQDSFFQSRHWDNCTTFTTREPCFGFQVDVYFSVSLVRLASKWNL